MGISEHLDAVKQHWARNFALLDYFKKVYGRHQPLPRWSDIDVDEFIASDPIYGLQALRESRNFTLGRALVGGTHLGGVAFKYSKSPHGFVLATRFGALCDAVFGSEVAEHWYQPYKMYKQGPTSGSSTGGRTRSQASWPRTIPPDVPLASAANVPKASTSELSRPGYLLCVVRVPERTEK